MIAAIDKIYSASEIWFFTGSQHLYGEELIVQVAKNSQKVTSHLSDNCPIRIIFKSVLTTATAVVESFIEAESDERCVGIICWMHTFSPGNMWINGLMKLTKPLLHLHTQFNDALPWGTIDMDFMNMNQSAHGDREFGHVCTKLGIQRKIVVGHWRDPNTSHEVFTWCRAAVAWNDSQKMKIARFGDNMRDVSVTDGDKVSAQKVFGYTIHPYGLGDLVACIKKVSPADVKKASDEYLDVYEVEDELKKDGSRYESLLDAARIEVGLSQFLKRGGYSAFTTNFENLTGLDQLPGIAVQRLMDQGIGFAAEGDWKTGALVRSMKVMSYGVSGGCSFMEDYTYHLTPGEESVLGAHMLEICPSISAMTPKCEIHPLSIGGKADPVRLVFNGRPGEGINVSIVDLGGRFRILVNQIESIDPPQSMPHLPVGRILWKPRPDFKTAAKCWIYSGGAHHTCLSLSLSSEHLIDFARIAQTECLVIDETTQYSEFESKVMLGNQGFPK